jgi:chaperonin GroES
MINFRPMNDRVLIRRDEAADKVGSLYVAEQARTKPQWGTVLAIGPGKLVEGTRLPVAVEPGMHVCFGQYAGEAVVVEDETLLLVREEDLLGVDM